jgi:hypothetical protein
MGILVRATAMIYCDGAPHRALEWSGSGEKALSGPKELARRAGWTIKRDGRVFCPEHADRQG